MRLAIISNKTSRNTQALQRVCQDADVECSVYSLASVAIDTDSLEAGFYGNDVYLFRGYNRNYHQAQALAHYLSRRQKIVIDKALVTGFIPSKLHEALVYKSHDIRHPRTWFIRSLDNIRDELFDFPVVVKDADSEKGKGVRLAQSLDELRREIDMHSGRIIVQEFVPMTHDIRVLCVGDQVLGAVRRNVVEGDFRSNVSLGATTELYQLSPVDKDLALRAHYAMGYDISGVDVGHLPDGTPFVIETNITPEWQGFEKATSIDVASHIIEYAKERYDCTK